MDNDGTLPAKDKVKYPRPLGGPEPSVQGVPPDVKSSRASTSPGYDYSSSMPDTSSADLMRGYKPMGRMDGSSS